MLVSKIWLVLLALAAAAGFATALVVPKPAHREIARAYAEHLDRGQHNAELILRLEARYWIDAVAKMAWDGQVVETLEQASNRRGELRTHQGKLQGRLLSLVGRFKAELRPQLLIAVDHRGKQIARVGPGEDKMTPGETGLSGYPLVEAALRGYRADDTWALDGKLYLMAASPVITRARGRYVGALLLGQEVNEAFARRLKSVLAGTDLAFFLGGKLLATTVNAAGLERLSEFFEKQREQIQRDGRSPATLVGKGDGAHSAIVATLPGEAGEHGAFFAAVGVPTPNLGLSEMLRMTARSDLGFGEFPWPLLLGVLIIALFIGFALARWEHDGPVRRLTDAVDRLARHEATRIEEMRFSGRFAVLAQAFNEALDKGGKRGPSKEPARAPVPETPAPSELNSALSLPAVVPVKASGVQPLSSISGEYGSVRPPPMAVVEPRPEYGDLALSPPAPPERDLGTAGAELEISATLSPSGQSGLSSLPEPELPGAGSIGVLGVGGGGSGGPEIPGLMITPSRSAPSGPGPGSGLVSLPSNPGLAASAFDLEPQLEPRRAATSASLRAVRLPASEEAALSQGRGEPAPLFTETQPSSSIEDAPARAEEAFPLPATGAPAPGGSDAEQEYFKQVFKEFLAIKQQCGENTSSLTYDRFAEKLRKNRDSLVKAYGCKAVKFQVYIKDGKAALKATPVKE